MIAVSVGGGGGDGHDGVTILTEAHDGLGLGVDELLLGLDLAEGFSLAEAQRRKGLVQSGELSLERFKLGLLLRNELLVLRSGLLRRFNAGRGGHLGGLVVGLGGDQVGDVLLELSELILFGKDADIELGGLKGDDAFAVGGSLGDDVADLGLGRSEFSPGFD